MEEVMTMSPSTQQNTTGKGDAGVPMRSPQRLMTGSERYVLGVYLIILTLLLFYLFGKLWPQSLTELTQSKGVPDSEIFFFGWLEVPTPAEIRVLLLVVCAGGLGGMLHTLRSLSAFAGNRQLYSSWLEWYIVRPLSGSLLALIFFLIIRGGLMSNSLTNGSSLQVAGLAGAGALVGMFSEQAIEKLREVFGALFSTREKDQREDPLVQAVTNPKPELVDIAPNTLSVGSSDRKIRLTGNSFFQGSKAEVDGSPRPTAFESDGTLVVTLDDGDVAVTGQKQITLVNPPPGGGTSESKILTIT
jgi:hypothetical protein